MILLLIVSISLVFAGYYEKANSAFAHKGYKKAVELGQGTVNILVFHRYYSTFLTLYTLLYCLYP